MALARVEITVPLRDLDLDVALEMERETVAVAGPSGSGKTTLLRSVAGLVEPAGGTIEVAGRTWFDRDDGIDLAPEDRSVGMLFQGYALFPHMTVAQNVSFAGNGETDVVLERFQIAHLARVRPPDLSGGERQRVALARAVARRPDLLLLDEPTAALDAATRVEVRAGLRSMLAELDLPCIVVTHDYEEAAALAGRIAVMIDGRIEQLGTPEELVSAPTTSFVASFTGANVLTGDARPQASGLTMVTLHTGAAIYSTDHGAGPVAVIVRPWDVSVAERPPDDSTLNHIAGEITSVVPIGNRQRVTVGGLTAEVTQPSAERLGLAPGRRVVASFKATATRLVAAPAVSSPAGRPEP